MLVKKMWYNRQRKVDMLIKLINVINISTGYDLKSINNKNDLCIHNLIKKK